MTGDVFSNLTFQSFFISNEITNSPLLVEIIKTSKKLKDKGVLADNSSATISLGFGKRILINGEVEDFSKIKKEEIIEIADYNPIKNILLVIGPIEPKVETPIHWMIHHARAEVNSIIQIHNSNLAEKLNKKIPIVDDKYPIISIEHIKEVLKALRNSNKIIIKNESILFIGKRLDDIEDNIFKTFEEIK